MSIPRHGHWPTSFPSTEQGWFYLNQPDAGAPNQVTTYGPYPCTRVPMNGQLTIAGKSGQQIAVDERIKLPLESGVTQRSVLVDSATGDSYEVVYLQRWSEHIEVYAVRKAAI